MEALCPLKHKKTVVRERLIAAPKQDVLRVNFFHASPMLPCYRQTIAEYRTYPVTSAGTTMRVSAADVWTL